MKLKIIYIAGLYHTGSTLLDLLLGRLPNIIGLGEIFKCFHDEFGEDCSCGVKTKDCEFWGEFLKDSKSSKEDIYDSYSKVIFKFRNTYGENKILVDSSKCHPFSIFSDSRNMQGLESLIKRTDIDLKVIHLVRDVRSWSNSLILRDKRYSKEHNFLTNLFMFFFRSVFSRFIQWYWGHKKITKYLKENKLEKIVVSYENLSLDPEGTMKEISEFIGEEYNVSSLVPKNSGSHIAMGNPMRFREKDTRKIIYDSRWMYSHKFPLPSLLLFPIMKFNNKLVYKK